MQITQKIYLLLLASLFTLNAPVIASAKDQKTPSAAGNGAAAAGAGVQPLQMKPIPAFEGDEWEQNDFEAPDRAKIQQYFNTMVHHLEQALENQEHFSLVEFAQAQHIPLDEWNALVQFTDENGWTLLNHATHYCNDYATQELLMDDMVNVNHVDKYGKSILMNAVETISLSTVNTVLSSPRVQVNWTNHAQGSALSLALAMRTHPYSYTQNPAEYHVIPAIIDALLDKGNANVLIANMPYSEHAQENFRLSFNDLKYPAAMSAEKVAQEKKLIADDNKKIIEKLRLKEQLLLKEKVADLTTHKRDKSIEQHFNDLTILMFHKSPEAPRYFARLKSTLCAEDFAQLLRFEDKDGRTLIFHSIKEGSLECVTLLTAQRAHCNLNHVSKNTLHWFAHTPLYAALHSPRAREIVPIIEPYVDYTVLVPRLYAGHKAPLQVPILLDVLHENSPETLTLLLASKRINTQFVFADLEQARTAINKTLLQTDPQKIKSDQMHKLLTCYETEKHIALLEKRAKIEETLKKLALEKKEKQEKETAALKAAEQPVLSKAQKRKEKLQQAKARTKAAEESAQESSNKKQEAYAIAQSMAQLIVESAMKKISATHKKEDPQAAAAAQPGSAAAEEPPLPLITPEQEIEHHRLLAFAHAQKSNAGRAAGKPKEFTKKKKDSAEKEKEKTLLSAAQRSKPKKAKETEAERLDREAHEKCYRELNAKWLEQQAKAQAAKDEELRMQREKEAAALIAAQADADAALDKKGAEISEYFSNLVAPILDKQKSDALIAKMQQRYEPAFVIAQSKQNNHCIQPPLKIK